MTNEEAIEYNKNLKMYMKISDKQEQCKFLEENYIALDMAIEALKSEIEYKAKVKELEDAIALCEQAEKEFKSRTCKFRSQINCNFCAFHSNCEEAFDRK